MANSRHSSSFHLLCHWNFKKRKTHNDPERMILVDDIRVRCICPHIRFQFSSLLIVHKRISFSRKQSPFIIFHHVRVIQKREVIVNCVYPIRSEISIFHRKEERNWLDTIVEDGQSDVGIIPEEGTHRCLAGFPVAGEGKCLVVGDQLFPFWTLHQGSDGVAFTSLNCDLERYQRSTPGYTKLARNIEWEKRKE